MTRRSSCWKSPSHQVSISSTRARRSGSAGRSGGSGRSSSSTRAIALVVWIRRPSMTSAGTVVAGKRRARMSGLWMHLREVDPPVGDALAAEHQLGGEHRVRRRDPVERGHPGRLQPVELAPAGHQAAALVESPRVVVALHHADHQIMDAAVGELRVDRVEQRAAEPSAPRTLGDQHGPHLAVAILERPRGLVVHERLHARDARVMVVQLQPERAELVDAVESGQCDPGHGADSTGQACSPMRRWTAPGLTFRRAQTSQTRRSAHCAPRRRARACEA